MMKSIFSKTYLLSFAGLAVTLIAMTQLPSINKGSEPAGPTTTSTAEPTIAEAEKFIVDAEKRLFDLSVKSSRADWVKSTFITDDTEALAAEANEELIAATTELAEQSQRFDSLKLPTDVARKLKLLKLSLTLPAPRDRAGGRRGSR